MTSAVSHDIAQITADILDDPAAMVDGGFVQINTSHTYGLKREEDEEELIRTMVLNPAQRLLSDFAYMTKRVEQKPVKMRILKARHLGISTWIQCRFVARTHVKSGVCSLTIAHRPTSAETLFLIGRGVSDRLPSWLQPDRRSHTRNSVECRDIANIRIGIRDSRMRCVPATENIDSVRGDRYLLIHRSECSRYPDARMIDEATSSLLLKTRDAEDFDESTGLGEDEFFYPRFMAPWEAQGKKSPYEPGATLFKHPASAWFFPWYFDDEGKIALLHPDIDYEWLLANLDNEEKFLLQYRITPLWAAKGHSDRSAMEGALRQLYWRRCKVESEYRNMPKVDVGDTLLNMASFRREEPATPEEAFSSSAGDTILNEDDFNYIAGTVTKAPVFRGDMSAAGEMRQAGSGVNEKLLIWKVPDEISGELYVGIDASAGLSQEGIGKGIKGDELDLDVPKWVNLSRDITAVVVMERKGEILEQVAEYITQDTATCATPIIWNLLMHFLNGRDPYRCAPQVIVETQFGQDIIQYLLKKRYPSSKIFKRDSKNFGFFARAQPQIDAVKAMQAMIQRRQVVLRSRWLAKQLGWFVEKGDEGKVYYEARHKHTSSKESKDDCVDALAMICYSVDMKPPPKGAQISGATSASGYPVMPEPGSFDGSNLTPYFEFLKRCEELRIDPSQAAVVPGGFNEAVRKLKTQGEVCDIWN